jgi:hypothetical protein
MKIGHSLQLCAAVWAGGLVPDGFFAAAPGMLWRQKPLLCFELATWEPEAELILSHPKVLP